MMKSEPRPFASLSSGLLARKGAARPAMRPQGFGQMGSGLEDLGWNDMGFEAPRPVLAPVEEAEAAVRINPACGLTPASPVHAVHEKLEQRFASEPEDEAASEEPAESAEEYAAPLAEVVAMPVVAEVPMAAPVAEAVPAPVVAAVPMPAPPVVAPAPAPVAVAPRATAPQPRPAAGAKGKAAFTLRLDADRHLKLRLACAVTNTSAQQLVTRALDEFLRSMPELEAMAERAPERRESKRS
jgi:hypothetical protein